MKSLAKTRATLTELAGAAGLSENGVRYRLRRGQMAAPDEHGLFDLKRALSEIARRPRQRGGRRRGCSKVPGAVPPARRDAVERFRLAKARLEEIKLRRMCGELVEVDAVRERVFRYARLWRDRMDAAVSREAPPMAADLGVAEGKVWLALKGMMARLQKELAEIDAGKALAKGGPAPSVATAG